MNYFASSDERWSDFLADLRNNGLWPAADNFALGEVTAGLITRPFDSRSTAICRRLSETEDLVTLPQLREGLYLDYVEPGWADKPDFKWRIHECRRRLKNASIGLHDIDVYQRHRTLKHEMSRNYEALQSKQREANLGLARVSPFSEACTDEILQAEAFHIMAGILSDRNSVIDPERIGQVCTSAFRQPDAHRYLRGITILSLYMKWRIAKNGTISPKLRPDFFVLAPVLLSRAFITLDRGQAAAVQEALPEVNLCLINRSAL